MAWVLWHDCGSTTTPYCCLWRVRLSWISLVFPQWCTDIAWLPVLLLVALDEVQSAVFRIATLDFAAINLMLKELLLVCHLMYAQAPKASLDTSEKMHNVAALITSSDVIGVSGLSKATLTLLRFFISWKKRIHSSRTVVGSSWSHSNPLCHNRCIPILARTVNLIGSNSRRSDLVFLAWSALSLLAD